MTYTLVFLRELTEWKNLNLQGNFEGRNFRISGVVIGKQVFRALTKLKVDDGTGVINCVLFPFGNDLLTENQLECMKKCYLGTNFASCLETLNNPELNVGDYAHLYGVTNIYNGEIQIKIHFYNIIKDTNTETQTILETLCMKNN